MINQLLGGIFEKKWMASKIKTEKMTLKEKLLGYLIGPFGMLALQAVVNQLAELYYTEIFYVDNIFGVGTYLMMSWVTKIVSMLFGLYIARIVERSNSSQGKIRPFVLIGQIICAISSFFMFFIPEIGNTGKLIWIYIFNIAYNGIGFTMFSLRKNMITLCTRDINDRNNVNLLDRMSSYLLVGVAVTMVVGSILYYTMLHGQPAINWIILVGIFSLLCIPLSFLNYFYTLERVTLDEKEIEGAITQKEDVNVFKRLKEMFSCKYFVMAYILQTLVLSVGYLQGYNLNTNFCTVILGATAENNYNLIFTIASGIPMGLGILFIYPLSKKITIRKTSMIFSVIAVIGCVMGLLVGNNFVLQAISCFIFNVGTLACIYILDSLLLSANDEVEYKYGYRVEGTVALAITTAIQTIVSGVFSGVYETGLSYFGYNADLGVNQNTNVINWLYFIRYVAPMIQYIIIFIVLIFMNLESKLPKMQEEILKRKSQNEGN